MEEMILKNSAQQTRTLSKLTRALMANGKLSQLDPLSSAPITKRNCEFSLSSEPKILAFTLGEKMKSIITGEGVNRARETRSGKNAGGMIDSCAAEAGDASEYGRGMAELTSVPARTTGTPSSS